MMLYYIAFANKIENSKEETKHIAFKKASLVAILQKYTFFIVFQVYCFKNGIFLVFG